MRRILLGTVAVIGLATTTSAQQTVRVGSVIDGDLRQGDQQLSSGEWFDAYQISGRAGQTITLRLDSSALDPYVMIRGPGGFSEENDDVSGSDRNSELTVRLPADGTYRILATSYQPGETGRYRLSVRGGGQPVAVASPSAGGTLRAGETVRGNLGQGDATIESGEFIERWTLNGRRGDTFDIAMRSTEFDPYLMVRGPGGLSQDNDDEDSRGSRNARIRFTLAADGPVSVGATSYRAGERGNYQLIVNGGGAQGNAQPAPPAPPPVAQPAAGTIAVGQTVNGALRTSDRQLSTGEYLNSYRLVGRAGQRVDLRLESSAFDTFVQINGPGEFVESNDDDPSGGSNSRLSVTLPNDGEYRVMVTSYAAREVGAYRLTASAGTGAANPGGRPAPGPAVATGPARPRPATGEGTAITIGGSAEGRLAQGDGRLESGEFVDAYRFTSRRGQRVAIDVTSGEFDTYLILGTPSGEQLDNDDGPNGTNARLDQVLPEDGEYRLQVTSYRPGETGAYRVSVAPSAGPERIASVRGGQRVYAVMVGISDYGSTANDLPYTDEDATKLHEALRDAGVLNPASVTLTNAQGTRAAVRSAIQRVAQQAGPDDVFLFFFSGHGVQVDGTSSATEPDGRDETIVLRDGNITDDEMAQLLAPVRARLSMIVLDSCYSGGFARDIVTRPGVMGVFSSEEDLTSEVASKFEAGGYVAHFMRAAVGGAADANGDRDISAGELATYLRERFAAPEVGRIDATTTEGQRNYQNLVIERGGVQVDDVVLRLGPASGRRN